MSRSGRNNLMLLVLVASFIAGSAARPTTSSNFTSTEDYITRYRINSERYRVTTEDGYQLITYRLRPTVPVRGVALLQHGIRESSSDWFRLSSNLPSQLLSAGIEVWLGNSRASRESAGHTSIRNTSADFWNFSFHEIGYYDLAALIDAALLTSNQKRINLIGFSEGSTAALVLLSERPTYNEQIASLNLIAPAAYMTNSQYRPIAYSFDHIRTFFPGLVNQIFAGNQFSGTSQKQLEHYRQLIISGRFQQYDYDFTSNYQRYGSKQPPEYALERISSPVVLHYGLRDQTVHPTDVKRLGQQLAQTTRVQMISYDAFAHTDFVGRQEAASLVYPKIVKIVTK